MIKKIDVKAFKSIGEMEFNCSKLNIITGTNSSGKSTLLQALLLFFQAYSNRNEDSYKLNGEIISLGEFREIKNYNTSYESINIGITTDVDNSPFVISFDENKHPQTSDDLKKTSDYRSINIQSHNINYLSCNRIGAQDVYMKNYEHKGGVGKNGEFAMHYLQLHKSDSLDFSLLADKSSETLYAQVNYWLNYIVNSNVVVEDVPGTDIVKGAFNVGDSRDLRPRNVGSGVSYITSLIIMCLSSDEDDVLIIENPEIHLHPKAQSRVCEFLYFVAKSGRQLFIETHSDHIFNGIRVGIATEKMVQDEVTVNFFELDNNLCTKNTVIEFGKRGRILNYTEGLFDQFDIDLNKILQL